MKQRALELPFDAWEISESRFPATGQPAEKLRFLLNYAVLAPSGHNSQPWFFKIVDGRVELYAERTRALPVVDPDGRELIMSCGAALFNLRIALRHFGYVGAVSTFPCPGVWDLLACVGLGNQWEATAEEHSLFKAIQKRHTNRMHFEDRQLPPLLLLDLQDAAWAEGAWLHIVEGTRSRSRLADLIAEGDRIQAKDKRFRRELAAWMRPNWSRSRDGLPGYAFGIPGLVSSAAPFIIRTLDWGDLRAVRDRQLAMESPVLAVIGTNDDSPNAWLSAGQALEWVLLRARAEGVWASFLNQPIEVAELRSQVGDVLSRAGFPQLLLRMGYGQEVKPTPRRAVSEVLC
jgi:nitroreductase